MCFLTSIKNLNIDICCAFFVVEKYKKTSKNKRSYHKKFFRPNLIFLIVMRLFPGTSRQPAMRPRGNLHEAPGLICWSPRGPKEPKFSFLGGFLALPTKTSFTTPHYYPKYEGWAKEIFVVGSLYTFSLFEKLK